VGEKGGTILKGEYSLSKVINRFKRWNPKGGWEKGGQGHERFWRKKRTINLAKKSKENRPLKTKGDGVLGIGGGDQGKTSLIQCENGGEKPARPFEGKNTSSD